MLLMPLLLFDAFMIDLNDARVVSCLNGRFMGERIVGKEDVRMWGEFSIFCLVTAAEEEECVEGCDGIERIF